MISVDKEVIDSQVLTDIIHERLSELPEKLDEKAIDASKFRLILSENKEIAFVSHRKILGPIIIMAKKICRKLTHQFIEQKVEPLYKFDENLIDVLVVLRLLQKHVDALERQIDVLQKQIDKQKNGNNKLEEQCK